MGLALWASVLIAPSSALAAERLYYFWSFSMPEASLKSALADGDKVGLIAVLRGLPEGSAKTSLGRLKRLLGNHKTEVLIEPRLFTLYGITGVPSLVYAEGVDALCESCAPVPHHAIVTGDVPLGTALEYLAREAPSVERFLAKLREGFYAR
ncbi:MAG: type-F conjugative transfer system pilin assembly protein TrbC [Nitrospirota bacterium]